MRVERTRAVGFEKSGLSGHDHVKMTSVLVDGNRNLRFLERSGFGFFGPVYTGRILSRSLGRGRGRRGALVMAPAVVRHAERESPSAPSATSTPSLAPWAFFCL